MHDARASKCDLHVHSKHSDRPSEWFLRRIGTPESFVEPREVYRHARQRGMDFVTISDHNCLRGALEIADLPGTFLSNEITTYFPENGCKVHVLADRHQRRAIPHDPGVAGRHLPASRISYGRGHHRVGGPCTVPRQQSPHDRPVRAADPAVPAFRADQWLARSPRRRSPERRPRQLDARDDFRHGRPAGHRTVRSRAVEEDPHGGQRRSQRGLYRRGLYADAVGLGCRRVPGLSPPRPARARRPVRRQRAHGPRLLSHRLPLLPGPLPCAAAATERRRSSASCSIGS